MADPITISIGPETISGCLFTPSGPPSTVILLNPATGVPQSYYRHFADWLTEQGYACLTYDYRGFGASAAGPVRAVSLRMSDWGITDQQAARDWLSAHFPDTPLWVIGHSLGAFMLGYQADLPKISRVIAVASGPIHVRHHPWPYQAMARFFWYALGPVLARTTGYLPARFSGLGADIPGPVFRQWKLWCTSRRFHLADPTLPPHDSGLLTAPLRSVALSDDVMIPAPVVARLGTIYPNAPQTHVTLDPAAFDLSKVGHLGVFARRNASLWPEIIADGPSPV